MTKIASMLCALLLALAAPAIEAAPAIQAAPVIQDFSPEAANRFSSAEQSPEMAKDPRDQLYLEDRKRQDSQTIIELVLLAAVAVATTVAALLAARTRTMGLSGRDVIRSIVMIFVIFGALALAIDVKTTETLTGVIGVLSATAGYLFGRATTTADEHDREAKTGELTKKS